MDTTKELLRTIQALYDAALDESLWPIALTCLEQLLDGNATLLYSVDTLTGNLIGARINHVPDECIAEYAQHYVHHDCRNEYILRNPTPELQYDYQHIDERGMRRSEHYQWLNRYDWSYYIGGLVYAKGPVQVYCGIQRSKRAGHVGNDEIRLYETLRPHLMQSVRIATTLNEVNLAAIAREQALEQSSAGILLLSETGNVLYMNDVATEIVNRANGLLISSASGLQALDHRDNEALRRLINSAVETASGRAMGGGGSIAVSKRSGQHRCLINVAPISRTVAPLFLDQQPRAVACIIDPDRFVHLSSEHLQGVFGLTAREAELLVHLAQGQELQAAAATMGVSLSTARTHLKNIFARTRTHRQAELVALVSNLRA